MEKRQEVEQALPSWSASIEISEEIGSIPDIVHVIYWVHAPRKSARAEKSAENPTARTKR
jgi:hypothetical protein